MEYSSVILNITLMLSSVESLRPSPIIVLVNMNITDKHIPLPIDGWRNLFPSPTDSAWKLLCEEQLTAQKIKYYSQPSKHKYVKLFLQGLDESSVEIRIEGEKIIIVHGLRCVNQEKEMFFLKNDKYEGFLSFYFENLLKRFVILFYGIITNHWSYEDAGKAAISLFGNGGIEDYTKEHQLINICASLFQGLSSTLVQSRASYYITKKTEIIETNNHLYCIGVVDVVHRPVFIKYKINFQQSDQGQIMTVVYVEGSVELTETKTYYWN